MDEPANPENAPSRVRGLKRARDAFDTSIVFATAVLGLLWLGRERERRHGRRARKAVPAPVRTAARDTPGRSWKSFLLEIWTAIGTDRLLANAAGVTFYALLAVFPAAAALVSIYGLFADPVVIERHLNDLSLLLPSGAIDIIGEQLRRVTESGTRNLGFGFAAGLLISLWSANAGVKALLDALNVVYGEVERRGFVEFTLVSFAFTIGMIAFLLLALTAAVLLPLVLNYVPVPAEILLTARFAPWPALLVIGAVALGLIYRYGPSRSGRRTAWISAGSLFASVAWLAASAAFSWYAANFGTFNETYGSLGAAVGFMFWIWISVIVILVGGEINAAHEGVPSSSGRDPAAQ